MMNALVDAYSKANPNHRAVVRGALAKESYRALVHRQTDAVFCERGPNSDELALTGSRGAGGLVSIPLAMDAAVLVVAQDNPLQEITLDQVRGVLTGEIREWVHLHTIGESISVLLPSNDDPLSEVIRMQHLGKRFLLRSGLRYDRLPDLHAALASRFGAMGVSSFGEASELRILPIRLAERDAPIAASIASIQDRSYPLAHYVFLTIRSEDRDQWSPFFAFANSSQGRRAIASPDHHVVALPLP